MSLKVAQALYQAWIGGDFGLPTAYPNQAFEPIDGVPYAQVYVAGNDTTAKDLAHTDVTDGVFRVILRYPANGGAIAGERKSEEIRKYYHIGKRFEYDGQLVVVRSYSQEPGAPDDGWYKLVLTIRYDADLPRIDKGENNG